jgi:hypothetical protein
MTATEINDERDILSRTVIAYPSESCQTRRKRPERDRVPDAVDGTGS